VPEQYTKGDFDHSSIQSWEDVELHEDKILEYIANDVLSMRFIYKVYATEFNSIYGANLSSAITLSHLCYMIWTDMITKTLPEVKIYKLPMDVYHKIIPGYYGGRVLLQKPRWVSEWFEEVMDMAMTNDGYITHELFLRIMDYLWKVDVVSLYPAVMEEYPYPCGKWRFINVDLNDEQQQLSYALLLKSPHAANYFPRVFMCVDVICPSYLYVPFLMSRGTKGELIQDLNPKHAQIYYGPEIEHAVKLLNYQVTKVHWIMEFDSCEYLFKAYMGKFWQVKKAATKGTVKYQTAKSAGNNISGKFGQKEEGRSTKIRTKQDVDKGNFKFYSYTLVNNNTKDDDDTIAMITQEPNDKAFASYPSYLSMAILARSRIKMSNYMLLCGGYCDPSKTALYGDTDSLILPNKCGDKLKGIMGSGLGQLDDEFCGGKAISFTGVALKTYNQIYVEASEDKNLGHRVLSVTRCKGIPHAGAAILVTDINCPDVENDMQAIYQYRTDPINNTQIPIRLGLKHDIYVITDLETNVSSYMNHIGHEAMNQMLQRSVEITCYYASIHKTVRGLGLQSGLSCYMALHTRRLCATDWWLTNKRRITPKTLDDMSKPYGFCNTNQAIATENELVGIVIAEEFDDELNNVV